ncbi:MAG: hypothetical protein EAZ42_03040 [Verrucomicrobia bacterium]|nr:MAG: hypothetical protein EAZ42_03040 [Verrucomicrobiota bacterium]
MQGNHFILSLEFAVHTCLHQVMNESASLALKERGHLAHILRKHSGGGLHPPRQSCKKNGLADAIRRHSSNSLLSIAFRTTIALR